MIVCRIRDRVPGQEEAEYDIPTRAGKHSIIGTRSSITFVRTETRKVVVRMCDMLVGDDVTFWHERQHRQLVLPC